MNVLEYARRRQGLTQFQLGKVIGVSKQLISAWETGSCPVDPKHYNALEKALHISFEIAAEPSEASRHLIYNLAFVRQRANISQEELGKLLGVPKSNVSAWENGTRAIPVKYFDALSSKLGIPIDDLRMYNAKVAARVTAPNADDLDEISRDLAKKIHQRAMERAKFRKGYFREQFAVILKREYRDFTDEQCLALIAEIASDTLGTDMVRAELSRMTHSIAFLADENKTPRAEVMQ